MQERLGSLTDPHAASCTPPSHFLHQETPESLSTSTNPHDLLALDIVAQSAWDLDAVPFFGKKGV
ncbi:hypothetical protein OG21DRAFT_1508450 [Imleria badia]|nr:hypothetical protein OG21DRAFT_1508450 [Imleria badia]